MTLETEREKAGRTARTEKTAVVLLTFSHSESRDTQFRAQVDRFVSRMRNLGYTELDRTVTWEDEAPSPSLPEKASEAPTSEGPLSVECSKCGAAAGSPCVTPSGNETEPHAARKKIAGV